MRKRVACWCASKNSTCLFIYQTSLPRGVGSNDLGTRSWAAWFDEDRALHAQRPEDPARRGQSPVSRRSDNADERQAIAESFARSVIWGFTDIDTDATSTIIDATAFFVRDSHALGARLAALGEGSFSVDDSRSAIFLPRTKAFPDNTEIEAIITLVGSATGPHLPTVVPDSNALTVHVHHSFIRLPDDNYEPLPYDPRAGVIGLRYDSGGFADYATPIGGQLIRTSGAAIAWRRRTRRPRSARQLSP